jgi:glycolate oxidase FAD binding subunit
VDLTSFVERVGADGPVGAEGLGTRGGVRPGVRSVRAPVGIDWFQPDEMTVACGAGTPIDELKAALAEHGQTVALPDGGTVGGALAVGHGSLLALGHGPVRNVLLQVRYVSAAGELVTAGGPTVKNVSGFDLARLLVGSRGRLGLFGDVILRTRPLPAASGWFRGPFDPFGVLGRLYRPAAVLWDGSTTWACLEGHPKDLADQVMSTGLRLTDGPPERPTGARWSISPAEVAGLATTEGRFVAEVGVGVVHHDRAQPARPIDPGVAELQRRITAAFDPDGRFGPAG